MRNGMLPMTYLYYVLKIWLWIIRARSANKLWILKARGGTRRPYNPHIKDNRCEDLCIYWKCDGNVGVVFLATLNCAIGQDHKYKFRCWFSAESSLLVPRCDLHNKTKQNIYSTLCVEDLRHTPPTKWYVTIKHDVNGMAWSFHHVNSDYYSDYSQMQY